jgi:hypothetical protein
MVIKDRWTPWIENLGIRVTRFPGEDVGIIGSGGIDGSRQRKASIPYEQAASFITIRGNYDGTKWSLAIHHQIALPVPRCRAGRRHRAILVRSIEVTFPGGPFIGLDPCATVERDLRQFLFPHRRCAPAFDQGRACRAASRRWAKFPRCSASDSAIPSSSTPVSRGIINPPRISSPQSIITAEINAPAKRDFYPRERN